MTGPGKSRDLTEIVLSVRADGWDERLYGIVREIAVAGVRQARVTCPAYVGVLERSWNRQAFDDLAFEFYADCIVPQLPRLRRHAERDGLREAFLHSSFRNWLVDRQRSRDPIGTANFKALRDGLERAVAEGILVRAPGEARRLSKTSLLLFPGASPSDRSWMQGELAGAVVACPHWSGLRDRLRNRGETPPDVLPAVLEHLRRAGCPSFVFGCLLDGLSELAGLRAVGLEDLPARRGNLAGSADAESEEAVRYLAARIRAAIDAEPCSEARRARMHDLVTHVVEEIRMGEGRLDLPEYARSRGLDRRRASELLGDLRRIAREALQGAWSPFRRGHG